MSIAGCKVYMIHNEQERRADSFCFQKGTMLVGNRTVKIGTRIRPRPETPRSNISDIMVVR